MVVVRKVVLEMGGTNPNGGCNCFYQCTTDDILGTTKIDFLKNELFPPAVAYLESSLSVRRTDLTLNRDECVCGSDLLSMTDGAWDKCFSFLNSSLPRPRLFLWSPVIDIFAFCVRLSRLLRALSSQLVLSRNDDGWRHG